MLSVAWHRRSLSRQCSQKGICSYMQVCKGLSFSFIALVTLQVSAKASQVQTFNVVGYPATNPQVQGAFTVSDSNGLAGPFANGGLGAYGMPSTMTISANGFTFDALSIGVGGINS